MQISVSKAKALCCVCVLFYAFFGRLCFQLLGANISPVCGGNHFVPPCLTRGKIRRVDCPPPLSLYIPKGWTPSPPLPPSLPPRFLPTLPPPPDVRFAHGVPVQRRGDHLPPPAVPQPPRPVQRPGALKPPPSGGGGSLPPWRAPAGLDLMGSMV